MSDEGFHEIQLNGKQLVFLFMAATVVSVVIFLCGVMVGRGVPDRAAVASNEPAGSTPETPSESTPVRAAPESVGTRGSGQETQQTQQAPPPAQQQSASPPPDQTPPEPAADEDVFKTLVDEQKDTSVGTPKGRPSAAPPKPSERPPAAKPPVSAAAAPAAAPAAVAAGSSSAASGYAVQLAAVRERGEADAIAKRLVSKGYQAYVLVPQPGKPPVYRVQVGRFKTRSEADRVASRLRKNEQFKPWVTR